MKLSAQSEKLLQSLTQLHHELRDHTRENWNRINPFGEDLFDWKERGAYWLGKDNDVTIYNTTVIQGDVAIGEHTWIGPYCGLDGTGKLSIGKYCSLSAGVYIHTHDTVKWAVSGGKAPYEYKPVSIGDCCFLGVRVIVLPGVSIGNHCVIGAGAVVTEDVPDFTIAAGVPARPVGRVVVEGDRVAMTYFKKEQD